MFLCFFMVIVMHCVYAVTDANLVLLADNVFFISNIFLYVCFIFCHFGLIYNEKGCVTALIGYTTLSRFFSVYCPYWFIFSARNCPVYEATHLATSSGVPVITRFPPLSPPSGPRSIT